MRKPISQRQLKDAVRKRLDKVSARINPLASDTNPQVVEIVTRLRGEHEALLMVLEAIEQKTTYFLEN